MKLSFIAIVFLTAVSLPSVLFAQPSGERDTIHLRDISMRDVCVLADPATQTYYMVGPGRQRREPGADPGPRRAQVRVYTSRDLATWSGPQPIYTVTDGLWGDIRVRGIWAPELHAYNDKYYLFLTFDTRHEFPEQWRDWRPRVYRGSQVLVADAPTGPYRPFANCSTLPTDMMTLDGTLWVEEGVPYMVFCHEWVQIKNGSVCYVRLTDDLSATVGEPTRLFDGSDGPWVRKSQETGCHVTDGPYLYTSKSGKLFMIWTSFGRGGYTVGLAISDSGKLAGPWRQQAEPLYDQDGGHGMLFTTFEGALMMALHSPNNRAAQPRLFEMEDTGATLRVVREFTGEESE